MAAATTTSRVPDARFLVSHPAHFLALGFGSGLVPWAPGTFGTAAGWLLYLLLALVLPPVAIAFLAIPLFFVGVWACGVTGRDLGVADHGAIVWDEILAFCAEDPIERVGREAQRQHPCRLGARGLGAT